MVTTYIYAENLSDFEEQVQETWDLGLGYQLVDVEEIGDNAWTGVFVGNSPGNAFDTEEDFAALEEQIRVRWDENYDLVDLDYVGDNWVAVFDKNFPGKDGGGYMTSEDLSEFADDTDEFLEKFYQRREQGYELIDYEQVDGVLLGIYEKPDSATSELSENLTDLAVFNSSLDLAGSVSI